MTHADRLLLFIDVVQYGSFSAAAVQHHIDRSTVSKQINQLEKELGVRLLQRSTRMISLTDIGRVVLDQAQHVRTALDETEALVASYRDEVRGVLRITSAVHFGRFHMQPVIADFLQQYPQAEVDLHLEDRFVDLIGEGFDLGIRITEPRDSNLIARKLSNHPVMMVASPQYLAQYGIPEKVEDLTQHRCIYYIRDNIVANNWSYFDGSVIKTIKVSGGYRVNDANMLIDAAKAGLGIALISCFILKNELLDGSLHTVLPHVRLPDYMPIYAFYPARKHISPKTRVFLDLLLKHVQTIHQGISD